MVMRFTMCRESLWRFNPVSDLASLVAEGQNTDAGTSILNLLQLIQIRTTVYMSMGENAEKDPRWVTSGGDTTGPET